MVFQLTSATDQRVAREAKPRVTGRTLPSPNWTVGWIVLPPPCLTPGGIDRRRRPPRRGLTCLTSSPRACLGRMGIDGRRHPPRGGLACLTSSHPTWWGTTIANGGVATLWKHRVHIPPLTLPWGSDYPIRSSSAIMANTRPRHSTPFSILTRGV